MKHVLHAVPPQEAHRSFNTQAVFGTAFALLTSGVFLSGLALLMGASDLLVSYISMITNICGVSILFLSSLVERFRSLKKATISFTVLSRLATLLLVFIPVFIPENARIAVFVPVMVLAFTLQAQTTVVLNNWLVAFVEVKRSGRYVARRQTLVLIATVILSLAGGRLLDTVSGQYIGFAALFSVAFLTAVAELATLLRIPDAEQRQPRATNVRFINQVRIPLGCRPFRRFVLYVGLFYLALSLADSFTVVYMMRYLNLTFVETTAMQMLLSLPQVFLLGLWGKISDRKGHQYALTVSIWFFVGETLFLALSNLENLFGMVPAAMLFASVGNAGFVVSVFNRRYELMPKENRIVYDNFYSAAVGLAFILGPAIGGVLKQVLEASSWISAAIRFGNIRLLYVVSAAAIIMLQLAVIHVRRKTGSN